MHSKGVRIKVCLYWQCLHRMEYQHLQVRAYSAPNNKYHISHKPHGLRAWYRLTHTTPPPPIPSCNQPHCYCPWSGGRAP